MAFENLASRLADTFKKLRGKGKLSEKDINQGLREVRLALLEADVNFRVVKQFIDNVRERCLDAEVMESLTPAQQVIKIVHQELITLLGGKTHPLDLSGPSPAVIALYGLQGSGKTTTAGKLALQLKKQGRRVLLVSCDVYRPAAQKQLELVADMAGVSFFTLSDKVPPEVIAQRGVEKAIESAHNVVILDTAGRLQIDDEMMEEARKIKEATSPRERLLVVDAMTGQEACQVAEEFDRVVDITGVILTKLDSDARGGAALSIAKVTGKPIKFASMGEKLEDFQVFHPDRMASRILGMGDVLTPVSYTHL
ncbi:MAG TPA: signal recognition particle protein, partial [Clostridiales bacterium UBA9857]|nr:signal recognition particle protein [Clostridiales bacterium UBA9857]